MYLLRVYYIDSTEDYFFNTLEEIKSFLLDSDIDHINWYHVYRLSRVSL